MSCHNLGSFDYEESILRPGGPIPGDLQLEKDAVTELYMTVQQVHCPP